MSYLGYTSALSRYLRTIDHPRVLEIGVDKGQTAIPLIHNLGSEHKNFKWVGIDVRLDGGFHEQLVQMFGTKQLSHDKMDLSDPDWNCCYLTCNSLDILPQLAQAPLMFDLIMVDGDHNYSTVVKELEFIEKLSFDSTLVIVDDYNGRWAKEDLFYKERESHSDIEDLKRPASIPGKAGVKLAVDDWLSTSKGWRLHDYEHDCVLLYKDSMEIRISAERLAKDAELSFKSSGNTFRFKPQASEVLKSGKEVSSLK